MTDLDRALQAYRAGDLDQAADALDAVLDAQPDHADALMLAGLVAHRGGTPEVAVRLFDRAVASDPDHDGAWCNRAQPLAALGRLDEAEVSVRRALSLRTTPQAAALLLRILLASGRPADAADAGATFTRTFPDHALLALLHGQALLAAELPQQALAPLSLALRAGRPQAGLLLVRALRALGRPADALRMLDRLPHDEDADTLNLRGLLHQDAGDPGAAQDAFRAALDADPAHGAAHHNLATRLFQDGAPELALPHHAAALDAEPDDHARWVGLVDSLQRCRDIPTDLHDRVVHALDRPGLAHQGIERAARHTVAADPAVAAFLDEPTVTDALLDALDRPLVHAWWRHTLVQGPTWERALTRLRRAALLDRALADHPTLLTSLAAQAWHTEHAWVVTERERATWPDAPPVLRALYAPHPPDADPGLLPPLLRELHLQQPEQERALAAELPSLGLSADATSHAVRAQYEQNPYPRLLSVHRKPPLPLPALIRAQLPHVTGVPDRRPLNVLIAGCGTGQQVLGAARYAHGEIVAIDLSRASLGVAARQVAERGLQDRVRLAQADLLALDAAALRQSGLPVQYDVIECGGVLHHLADPLAGWRRLIALLAPDGLMKIALYSTRARVAVHAARDMVHHLPLDADGLRASRALLLDLPKDHPAHPVVWSVDFPSLSGFRDLVRHASEHTFTLPELAGALHELGLELLGFQHPDPRAAAHYRDHFPDDAEQRDLDRWALVEAEHPESFVGMYQFWCRRR